MRAVTSQISLAMILTWWLLMPGTSAAQQVNQPDHEAGAQGNNTSESETSVAIFGSTIVVAWNDTRQGKTGSLTGYGYSTDGGATFTDAGQLSSPSEFRYVGDPSLGVDRNGRFYFASLIQQKDRSMCCLAVTWSVANDPVVFTPRPAIIEGVRPGSRQDKELIAVDTTGGPFDGRVYVAWTEFSLEGSQILFTHSTSTSPLEFAPPMSLSMNLGDLNHGAMPVVAPNGDVYVVWGQYIRSNRLTDAGNSIRVTTDQSIQMIKSDDGGVTFQNPDFDDLAPIKTVAAVEPSPDWMTAGEFEIRARAFPALAVDQTAVGSATRGNLYLVYHGRSQTGGVDNADIFFTRSANGGLDWDTPRVINKAPAATANADTTTHDNWQPAIAVSPADGTIIVSFNDRRTDPENIQIALFQAVSTDGGLTWLNAPVSTQATENGTEEVVDFAPGAGGNFQAEDYLGDYNQVATAGEQSAMVWTDLRNQCAPPQAAMAPCDPVGRPDMDVFYSGESKSPEFDLDLIETSSSDTFSFVGTPAPVLVATPIGQPALAKSSRQSFSDDGYAQVLDVGCARAFEGVAAALADARVPMVQEDIRRGSIETASITLSSDELKALVTAPVAQAIGERDGRYILEFQVACPGPEDAMTAASSAVTVSAQLVINDPDAANMLGGWEVPSNGVLETRQLEAVTQQLPATIPVLSLTDQPGPSVRSVAALAQLPSEAITGARLLPADQLDDVVILAASLPAATPSP